MQHSHTVTLGSMPIFNELKPSLHRCEPRGSHIDDFPVFSGFAYQQDTICTNFNPCKWWPSLSNEHAPYSVQPFYTQWRRIITAKCIYDIIGQRLTTETLYMWNIWVLPGRSLWLTSLEGEDWQNSALPFTVYCDGIMLCYQDVWCLRRWLLSHFMGAFLKDIVMLLNASQLLLW